MRALAGDPSLPEGTPAIHLLVADVDGCLVPLRHAAYDLAHLAEIAALNRQSREDDAVPPLALLTGRPHPYVDALMQILDVTLPSVFENGAGLAIREPYHARFRPEASDGMDRLDRLRDLLADREDVTLQPGKMASMTVFPYGDAQDAAGVESLVRGLVEDHHLDLQVDPAQECVNVLLPNVDKGLGFRWLTETIGVDRRQVAGVGDSAGDLAWLHLCGVACAPAGADPDVRSRVHVRPEGEDAAATLELYRRVIAHNRSLADRAS